MSSYRKSRHQKKLVLIPDPHESLQVYRYQVGSSSAGAENVISGAHILTVKTDDDFEVTAYSYPSKELISSHVNVPVVGIDYGAPYTVIVSSLQPADVMLQAGTHDTPAHIDVLPGVQNVNLDQFYKDTVALCRAADLSPTKDVVQSSEFRISPNITTRGLDLYLTKDEVYIIIGMEDGTYAFEHDEEDSSSHSLIGRGGGLVAYRIDEPGYHTIKMTAVGVTSALEAHLFTRT